MHPKQKPIDADAGSRLPTLIREAPRRILQVRVNPCGAVVEPDAPVAPFTPARGRRRDDFLRRMRAQVFARQAKRLARVERDFERMRGAMQRDAGDFRRRGAHSAGSASLGTGGTPATRASISI